MPTKITYLLGAGASANALPTAKESRDESGGIKLCLSDSMKALAGQPYRNDDVTYQYEDKYKIQLKLLLRI